MLIVVSALALVLLVAATLLTPSKKDTEQDVKHILFEMWLDSEIKKGKA